MTNRFTNVTELAKHLGSRPLFVFDKNFFISTCLDMSMTLIEIEQLHKPFGLYNECVHKHTDQIEGEVESDVIDTGEYLTCADGLMYYVCTVCCLDFNEQQMNEMCLDTHDHAIDKPICNTSAIIEKMLEAIK